MTGPLVDQLSRDDVDGLILTGEGGSGKSTLALQLARTTTDEPVVIRGTDIMATVPFGTLHTLVAGLLETVPTELPALLNAVTQVIATSGAGHRRPLFVVDNAHLLDDASAHVLAQITAQRTARAVVVAPSLGQVPQPLLEPWREARFVLFDVPALTPDELAGALTARLGGPVALPAVHAIGRAAHWNPLFTQYVVAEMLEHGSLQQREGVWVVSGLSRLTSDRVVEVLAARVGRWDEGRRRVLEALALTDGLGPHLIEALADPTDIAALLNDGTLEATSGPDPVIRIRQRLIADLVRAQIPITERRRWWEEVNALPPPSPANSPETVLALALWTLDCGTPLDPALAVRAARVANSRFDPELALRLVADVHDGPFALPAAIAKARAWRIRGEYQHGLNALRPVLPSLTSWQSEESDLGEFALEFVRSSVFTGPSFEEAWSVVRQTGELARCSAVERAEWELLLAERRMLELSDRVTKTRSPEPPSDPAELRHWLEASCYLVGALTSLGRHADALDVVAQLDHAERMPSLDLTDSWPLLYFSLLMMGESRRARALLPEPDGVGTWQAVYVGGSLETAEGIIPLLSGRPLEARPHLFSALGQWMAVDNMSALGLTHQSLAYCLAQLGDIDLAVEHQRRAELSPRGPRHLAPLVEVFYFGTQLRLDPGPATLEALRARVSYHREAGRSTLVFWLLTLGAQARDGQSLDALAAGPLPQPSTMAEAVVAWARATRSSDAEGLVAAAEDLAGCDVPALARRAAETARGLTADPRILARATALLATLDAEAGPTPPGRGAELLTPREREVARLAASGAANRDIAAQLFLSLRTVESYLSSTYAKLGVTGRRELAEVL